MPSRPPEFSLSALLRHGLITAVFCCLIGAGLALSTGRNWDLELVYSFAIGLTTWLTIDLGRFVVRSDSDHYWAGGVRGLLLIVVGIAMGFFVGTTLGDLYCGCSTWEWYRLAPNRLISSVVVTLAAGAAGSYFFHSRGQAKMQQAKIALAERDAAQARLKLLQAQLEPHMLFNTLANLRALIGADPVQATQMLDRLVGYLRATLIASRATEHTLAEEFDRLHDYLELMAVRMGPRLHYTLDLPAELAESPVPTLLLQPLVENSIRHGLEPQIRGGNIGVTARRIGDQLHLEVVDTGKGFAAPLAGAEAGRPAAGTGFGLTQVRERLATAYGTQASLSVSGPQTGGSRALVVLPVAP